MPMPKPPKLKSPSDVAESGDPYSCQRTGIYFCTHKGFNNWYGEHMAKFFGEPVLQFRRKKKKSLDVESSVKDIIAASAKPTKRLGSSESQGRLGRSKSRSDSRGRKEAAQVPRSKSPTKKGNRNISSAPASRLVGKTKKKNPGLTENNKKKTQPPPPQQAGAKAANRMVQTYPQKRVHSANAAGNVSSSRNTKGKKKKLLQRATKEFLPEKKVAAKQSAKPASAATSGKLFNSTDNAMEVLKNYVNQNGDGDLENLMESVDKREVSAAVLTLTNKSASPEVAVRLAQAGVVRKVIKLMKLELCGPWALHALLCMNNLSAFLLRSKTARTKYFSQPIMASLLKHVGMTVVAIVLEASGRDEESAVALAKAAVQLITTIAQASEDDTEMSELFRTHGGLHILLLLSYNKNMKEVGKMARILLGRFKNTEMAALKGSANVLGNGNDLISKIFHENLDKELEKRESLKSHQTSAFKRQRGEALKAHNLVEERRKKNLEFLKSQDEKSRELREKIMKRVESVNEKKRVEDEAERERIALKVKQRREALVEKRKEMDCLMQEKEAREKEERKRKAKEQSRVAREKEVLNEDKVKMWLESKRNEKKKRYQDEISRQKSEHEQNLKSLQQMRKQMDDVLARARQPRSPRRHKTISRRAGSRSPRSNSRIAKKGLKLLEGGISPPRINGKNFFPPLSLVGSSLKDSKSVSSSVENFDPTNIMRSPPSPIRVKPPSPARF